MNDRMDARVASSVLWRFLERGVFAVVQFAVQVLLARLLVPEDFGALAIMLAFTNVGIIVSQSGLNTALVQNPDVTDRDFSTVFWMCLALSSALFLVMFASAPTITAVFENPQLTWPLRIMSSMLLANAFASVAMARLMRRLNFKLIFYASSLAVIVSGVAGVLCATGGLGLWALVVQQVGYYAVLAVLLAVAAKWCPRMVFESHRAGTLFSFGWKLLFASLLDAAYQSLSDLLIGKRFDSYSLGLVSQGKRWPQAIGYLLDGSIQPVMLSAVSRIQDDVHAVKRLTRRMLCTYTYFMFPMMTVLIVCTEPIVLFLLGEQWLPCVPFMRIYCMVYVMLPIHTTNIQVTSGLGRSDLILKLEIIKKTYSIILLLLAVSVIGNLYLITVTFVIVGIISLFVSSVPTARLCSYPIGEQLHDIVPAFVVACVSGGLAWLILLLPWAPGVVFVCQVVIICCVYLALSALFRIKGLQYARLSVESLLGRKLEKGSGR